MAKNSKAMLEEGVLQKENWSFYCYRVFKFWPINIGSDGFEKNSLLSTIGDGMPSMLKLISTSFWL